MSAITVLRRRLAPVGVLCAAVVGGLAWADFEVKAPDGRTLLIKDDGTWTVATAPEAAASAAAAASAPAYDGPQAELRIEARRTLPSQCAFSLVLQNNFPYEIRNLVPEFVAERADGAVYSEQTAPFQSIRPGDVRRAELVFYGVACADIARLVVQRGDRCEMGELHRFLDPSGQCLARVKLMPTDLLKFEKRFLPPTQPAPIPPPAPTR